MAPLIFIIEVLLFFYVALVIYLIIGWHNISINFQNYTKHKPFVTIIVIVRNEEKYIDLLIQSIENQVYPSENFELIIVDDCSTDKTVSKISKYIQSAKFDIRLIHLTDEEGVGRKKMAITKAVQLAKGSLIMATDGDCAPNPKWIESLVSYYQSNNYKFISGPVTFFGQSFFDKIQIVEFASLIGTGASSIQWKAPNMCNGANLAFEKEAFWAVNGYEGFENQPSGDDEFLMHKINNKYLNSIGFIKSKEAIVITNAQSTISSFYNQRKRWASKWNQYLNIKNTILALFVFTLNFAVIITICLLISNNAPIILLILLFLKLIFEWIFIGKILLFLDQNKCLVYIPMVQIIYPFYILFTALGTLSKKYSWKGRNY